MDTTFHDNPQDLQTQARLHLEALMMTAVESTGPEYLISQSTHTCLTVISGTDVHDAKIKLSKCNGNIKQQWFHENGQWLWGGNRSLCLYKDDRTGELCLARRNSASKLWSLDNECRLVLGSEALDVPWQSPRNQVIFYPKHSGGNQKWWTLSQLNECLEDDDLAGEHCLETTLLDICKKELSRNATSKTETSNNFNQCNCQVENDFSVVSSTGDVISCKGTEYLISQSTLACLTVCNTTNPSEAIVELAPFTGDVNQQWVVRGCQWLWAGNKDYCLAPNMNQGILKLINVSTSRISWKFEDQGLVETNSSQALDVPWEVPRKRVILYPQHGGGNQKWWRLSHVKAALHESLDAKAKYPEALVKMADRIPYQNADCICNNEGNILKTESVMNSQTCSAEEPEFLISRSTHTCLTVLEGNCPEDASIGLAPYTGDIRQQWFVQGGIWNWAYNPSYSLGTDPNKNDLCLVSSTNTIKKWTFDKSGFFMNGSYCLDVPWEGKRTDIILYTKHGGINQKWYILSHLKSCVGRKLYPFSARDENCFKKEVARGIVNQLCPLSHPLPHPRDISHYPGTVSASTPKVDLSCTLYFGTVQQSKNLRMTVPKDWQATNMYVVAGEIFTVHIPDTLTEKEVEQITIRVGAHCDSLNPSAPNLENGKFKRMPVISEEFDVNKGINHLRSQFGGNLIFTYEGNEQFSATIRVKNIVETAHYILGKTSIKDWEDMQRFDAPFCVLETTKVVLIVPTKEAKFITNVDDLLHRYDDVLLKLENLSGFTKDDPPPKGKQWLVDDVQITAGSAHAGFPAMFDNQYYNLASPNTPHDWVVWHELGHNYQQGPFWSYAYGTETTVNLFSLYIEEELDNDDRLKREGKYLPTVKAVDNGLTFEKADCWQKLVFLMEIKHAFPNHGWDIYRHLNRTVRKLSDAEAKALASKIQNQYDYVYRTLSQYIGVDLLPHYQRWKLPLSSQAINAVKSLGLPLAPYNLAASCQSDQCAIA